MEEKQVYGRIHSFETLGTVDGPGVRFVIFVQGCALSCKYCHNRDTWPINAGQKYTASEIIQKIKHYKSYICPKGGVTVTGGEPLLQPDFLIDLFKNLKRLGYHTAIDTSGMVEITDKIKEVLSYTDLVLLDIKHIDSRKCKALVGHPNKLELQFAKYLSDNNIPMWIRQVIVPGITDKEEDLLKLKEFIASLKTVKKVELSGYHTMGKYKWEELGVPYPLEGVREATKEDIKRVKQILEIK